MKDTKWTTIDLHGAGAIAKVVGSYEVMDARIPGGRFKAKVLQHGDGGYVAHLNVCLKTEDGIPDGMAGNGRTEDLALQDAIKGFMMALAKRKALKDEDFEWSDPVDF
ncbi:MAG: hypothetical protein U0271_34045 [Polyangiaceae bacterium]